MIEYMNKKLKKNFLVALLKTKNDLQIALTENWYRIPCKIKRIPPIVKDKSIEYIAFYQPKSFNEEGGMIKYYAVVKDISIIKRKDLLPLEYNHINADEDYFKISFNNLIEKEYPILSNRKRRILFISTTFNHFEMAKEVNDLFYESPIEERMWEAFKRERIVAERQYYYSGTNKNLILDFALFCHNRNINVECDGDEYHLSKEKVLYDKKRNNYLESQGWSVLRFSSDDITKNLEKTLDRIKATINQNGGLEIIKEKEYRYFDINNDPLKFYEPQD